MKLVNCYIENFGGLRHYSMDFQDGLTILQAPNGFGKTTLAEFIRAMFYGFPRKKGKLGKRQKYTPWSGAKCRGHLTFEHEGVQYRIERTFGATGKGDTCKIYDLTTGQETTRFSSEVGLELFGLDADSFERSTYLPQNGGVENLTTDSIRAKLGDLVEDANDVGNFEKAIKALNDKRRPYKYKDGKGTETMKNIGRITALQAELDTAQARADRLAETEEHLKDLEKEQIQVEVAIKTVRTDLEIARTAEARMAHHRRHDEMAADLAEAEKDWQELQKTYPKGLPTDQELEAIAEMVERAARLNQQSLLTEDDHAAQQTVEACRAYFENGVPSDEDFDRMYQLWDDRRTVAIQLEACTMTPNEEAELAQTQQLFAHGVPDENIIRDRENDLEQASRLRRDNQHLASQSVLPGGDSSKTNLVPILMAAGGVGLATGVVLLALSRIVPGCLLMAVGVLTFLAAGYLNLKATMNRQSAGIGPQIQSLLQHNEEAAAALEAEARAFQARYNGLSFPELRHRVNRFHELSAKMADQTENRRSLNQQLQEYDAELEAFFEAYHFRLGHDPYDRLNRLQQRCGDWKRAMAQLEQRDARMERRHQDQTEVTEAMEAFRQRYGAAPRTRGEVLTLRDDCRRAQRMQIDVARLTTQLAQYRREYADVLAMPVAQTGADSVTLTRREQDLLLRQNAIAAELLTVGQKVQELRRTAEQIPVIRDELASWQEKKEADQHRADLLDDTMDFLGKARDGLATAYMGPIRDSFADLMNRMTGQSRQGILVNQELEVSLEREGASRDLAYFSAGQADLVMLCMRLALVDALFREAKPFVILDDPFVNLDDEHTAAALELLEDLSRERQILYLVCHSSRAGVN